MCNRDVACVFGVMFKHVKMLRFFFFFCLAVTFVLLSGTADALLPVQISVAIFGASHQNSRAAVVVTD